jgi:hypothetical protein
MLRIEDGLTRAVFSSRFEAVSDIFDKLAAALPRQQNRSASRNYFHVLDFAKSKAKLDGSPLILECHLLSALLGLESTALESALKSVATSRLELLSALQTMAGGPTGKTAYSTFSEFSTVSHELAK